MAAIYQYVPHMDDLPEPKTATFDTVDQLVAIPWVAMYREWDLDCGTFYRFSVKSVYLVAEFGKGAGWVHVGTLSLDDPAQLASLPQWVRPIDEGES